MNIKILQKLLSYVYFALASALLVCMLGGLWMGESLDSLPIKGFLKSILIVLLAAITLKVAAWKDAENTAFFRREALCTIGLTWLSTSLLGALPFYFGLEDCHFLDAIFESTSGLTTTGATIFKDFSELSYSLFLWRSLSQWIGGLGVLVFFVAILTSLGAGAKILFSNESSATASDFEQGRIQDGVIKLLTFYFGLTVLCFFAYKLAGMNWFDAVNHAMTTIATGGYSTHAESFAYFDNFKIEIVSIVFMLLSATTFIFLIRLLEGSKDVLKRGDEVYTFYSITLISTLLIALSIQALPSEFSNLSPLREAVFQTVSIITTTGYTSGNYDLWTPSAKILLMFLMVIGGCSGSTSGGLKIIRILIAFKAIFKTIVQTYRPNKTIITRIGSKTLNDAFVQNVLLYILFIFTIQGISVIILSLLEPSLNLISVFSVVQSSLYNIGPGFEAVGPANNYGFLQDPTKLFLSFLMILGRLEIYALVVLFLPNIWKRYA